MIKRVISLALSLVMVLSLMPVSTAASAEDTVFASGTCGAYNTEAITWTLYENGTLEFTGTGNMYNSGISPTWNSYDDSISEVVVNEGITSVRKNAFAGCSNLVSVSLPKGLQTIGESAFYNCTGLTSITIPEGVTSIGEEAFDGCTNLASISLPDTLTTIKNYAFWNCSSLTSIDLPDSLTKIEYGTFSTCTGLTTIEIPKGVTNIDSFLVRECSNMESFELWYTVTKIEDYVFKDCPALSKIIFHGTQAQWNAIAIDSTVTKIMNDQNVTIEYVDPCLTGHSPVMVSGKAASCTESGLTDGIYCNVCGVIITEQTEIPAKGHDYASGVCSCGLMANGTCGDNLIWTLTKDGTLIISGSGDMEDYSFGGYSTPWNSYMSNVKHVVIADGVTAIGSYAFMHYPYLTSLEIADTVTRIGEGAFEDCIKLTGAISLPNVVRIDDYAFSWTDITSVSFGDSLTEIGKLAFRCCNSLESVYIPASVAVIDESAFYSCSGLNQILVDEANVQYCNDSQGILYTENMKTLIQAPGGISGSVVIPDGVEHIEAYAFAAVSQPYSNTTLTEVVIPATVTEIGGYAFMNNAALSSITFEGNAPTFGVVPFANVTSTAYYPANSESWTDEVMQSSGGRITWEAVEPEIAVIASGTCGENLIWTLLEDGTLTISGEGAMEDYDSSYDVPWKNYRDSIVKVELQEGVSTIGDYSFQMCKNVTSVSIPDTVNSIGWSAFNWCSNLASVSIPAGVAVIESYAFGGCNSLTSITIPSSVIDIGIGVFSNTDSLRGIWVEDGNTHYTNDSVGVLFDKAMTVLVQAPGELTGQYEIPEGVTSIQESAFLGCDKMMGVVIPKGITSIEGYTFSCTGLTNVEIPASVMSISWYAFADCTNLEFVTVPESVTNIEAFAFSCCVDLTSLTIPSSVTEIGNCAFESCSSLSEITFVGNAPVTGEDVFYDVTATAYYPLGNETWTDEVMQNYGGDITWVAYEPTVEYTSLGEALAAAQPGDTVKLLADTVEEDVIIHPGVTLDLNGYTLTADYVFTVKNSSVIDSSADNTGVLKVPDDCASISPANAQLPVWSGEGYVFTTVEYKTKLVSSDSDSLQFAFLPQFKSGATALLEDGVDGNKVTIEVRVSWLTTMGREYRNLVFNENQVDTVVGTNGAFILTFSGFSQLSMASGISVEGVVISETGVSIASEATVVDVTNG